jgi:CRISPR/Cas system CSM-associated protein Csm3 (group 7 of RAMP superfamily)
MGTDLQTKRITGKIVLKGMIECLSPLHIGSGIGQCSDLDVLLDDKGQPFIPASALIGILREATERLHPQLTEEQCNEFWGYTKGDDGRQSAIQCSDLPCEALPFQPVIRDGVRIDHITGIAQDQGKYDYELVERGTTFRLNMEFSYQEANKRFVRQMAATIYDLLAKQHIRLGAKTNSGLGEIKLVAETANVYEFDFTQKTAVWNWLTRTFADEQEIGVEQLGTPLSLNQNTFTITAAFRLKNSLIVRSYSTKPEDPDATHIKSGDDWVLPGTSIKGAIRARAERILNTLGKPTENIINDLFGFVDETTDRKKKGRLRMEETLLPNFAAEQQTRIKIDRFTGGTIESALFDTMPLFSEGQASDKCVRITMHIRDYQDDKHQHEAGLLLLILKDLWTGDLAVGGEKNIGRGVFEGIQAIVEWNGETIRIEEDFSKLSSEQKKTLQGYVDALNNYREGKQ